MKVPSGGIMFGYAFFACAAFCVAVRGAPLYLGPSLRKRCPWDGGLNLVGWARTFCLGFAFGGLLDALRRDRAALEIEAG